MSRKIYLEGGYYLNPGASGVGTVVIGKIIPWERLILITNVSKNKVIYNFSDPSLLATNVVNLDQGALQTTITNATGNGTNVTYTAANTYVVGQQVQVAGITPSSFNTIGTVVAATATTFQMANNATGTYVQGGVGSLFSECTVVYLKYNTASAGMTSADEIQVTMDEFDERFKPAEEITDPVGKLRTSTPQALIDTDFEYGRQESKWESLNIINGRPFATGLTYNQIIQSDVTPSTAGTKTVTVTLSNATVATTATGVQGNGYTAIYTTASAHNLAVGQFVTVTGITPSGYNTTSGVPAQILEVPTSTTFRIANPTTGQSTVAGTVTSNVAPPVGYPITIQDTFASHVTGNYIVETRPGETSFTFSAKGSTPSNWASLSVNDPNKTIITQGDWYRDAMITNGTTALSITNSGQAVTVTTPVSHGLSIGNEIGLTGTTAASNNPVGNWYVAQVTSPTSFVFYSSATPTSIVTSQTSTTATGVAGSNIILVANGANINVGMQVINSAGIPAGTFVKNVQGAVVVLNQDLTAAMSGTTITFGAALFPRPQAQSYHRAFDGGVMFTSNGTGNNTALVRQTRRYFRYQSGKGIQMSSGTILRPTYAVESITSSGNVITIKTKERHGLQPGYQLSLYGVNESNYNGSYFVFNVLDLNTFTIVAPSAPTVTQPTGSMYVAATGWHGAVNRLGIFDQQNGLFFEYDGTTLYAVRRSSTLQIEGRVSVTNGSSTVTGSTNAAYTTYFNKQLVPGDWIVIRGQSYRIADIASDTSMTLTQAYRGITANQVTVSKTVDYKIPQSQWNLDKMNGGGPSEYNLDLSKMQMFYIDFSWYGAGAIRWGFRGPKGNIVYAHKMMNNNQNPLAYMRSGNLPGRYESATYAPTTQITASVGASDTTINVGNTYGFATPAFATTTATGTSGQPTVVVNSAAGIVSGMFANATNIAGGTQVVSVSGTTVTLTANNTGAVSGAITFTTPPGSAIIRSGSTYELINYTGYTSNTLTGVTRAAAGSGSLALTQATTSNIATVSSTAGLQVGQKIISPVFDDGAFIVALPNSTTVITSSAPKTANPTVIVAPAGATSGQSFTYSATAPVTVENAFPNFMPTIAHWGTSVIMDGLFNDDKSLLFTYGQNAGTTLAPVGGVANTGTASSSTTVTLGTSTTNIVPGMYVIDSAGTAVPRHTYVVSVNSATSVTLSNAVTLSATAITFYGATTKALMSIRIAPSVDNGIPAAFGARELTNRMQLILKALDLSLSATTTGNVLVLAYLNGTVFNPTAATGTPAHATWSNAIRSAALTPNSSLSQIADFAGGNYVLQGGEVTGGFFTNSTGQVDLSGVRDLGNSVLGGGSAYSNTGVYPDGPDVLTIVVQNVGLTAQTVQARLSWTEAQA